MGFCDRVGRVLSLGGWRWLLPYLKVSERAWTGPPREFSIFPLISGAPEKCVLPLPGESKEGGQSWYCSQLTQQSRAECSPGTRCALGQRNRKHVLEGHWFQARGGPLEVQSLRGEVCLCSGHCSQRAGWWWW